MIDLTRRHVMAILNVTPDSFFAGSRTMDEGSIEERVSEMLSSGATIVDIGGYSSRPGAVEVDLEHEWSRVALGCRVVRRLSREVAISIDTFRSEVVRRVVEEFGEVIVNDITAGEADENMVATVAKYRLPYVAMHMRGTPQTMQQMAEYQDVVSDVVRYFESKIAQLQSAGVERIILDPGFGFAKSLDQNYELMAGLESLVALGCVVLVGVSRKSMIYKELGCEPKGALSGTISLGWEALRQGATILRVHDTAEAVQSLRIFEKYMSVCR